MKNEPITLLVDTSGNNARSVNPYPTKINDGVYEYENRNHLSFEATVKYIPLTTPQIPNSVIKGVEVFQVFHSYKGWIIADPNYAWHKNFKNRKAYEPIPIEEKEQVKEESKWTAIE